jgi:hypothetical protein
MFKKSFEKFVTHKIPHFARASFGMIGLLVLYLEGGGEPKEEARLLPPLFPTTHVIPN